MGNAGASAVGMAEAPVTLRQSIDGILMKVCSRPDFAMASFHYKFRD
jgi:hypothetical protein